MKKCECLVLKETDDSGTHYSDEIEYCPLHANAERMRKFIIDWKSKIGSSEPLALYEKEFIQEAQAILKEIGE